MLDFFEKNQKEALDYATRFSGTELPANLPGWMPGALIVLIVIAAVVTAWLIGRKSALARPVSKKGTRSSHVAEFTDPQALFSDCNASTAILTLRRGRQ